MEYHAVADWIKLNNRTLTVPLCFPSGSSNSTPTRGFSFTWWRPTNRMVPSHSTSSTVTFTFVPISLSVNFGAFACISTQENEIAKSVRWKMSRPASKVKPRCEIYMGRSSFCAYFHGVCPSACILSTCRHAENCLVRTCTYRHDGQCLAFFRRSPPKWSAQL